MKHGFALPHLAASCLLAALALTSCSDDKPKDTLGRLSGAITLEGRTDHTGIEVSLGGTDVTARTDAEGLFRVLSLPPGTYELTARQAGFETGTQSVTIAADKETKASPLVLGRIDPATTGRIEGSVSLSGDADPTGIRISVTGSAAIAFADEDGAFVLSGAPAGTQEIVASFDGYDSARANVTVVAGQTAQAPALVLSPAAAGPATGVVRGQVTLEGESDSSGIVVSIEETTLFARTDADGSFVIRGVSAGSHRLAAAFAGFVDAGADITVVAGGTLVAPALELARTAAQPVTGAVAGTVSLSDAASPEGVLVYLAGTGFSALAGADGAFSLGGVPAGDYRLVAQRAGYARAETDVEIVAGETLATAPLVLTHIATTGSVTGTALLGDASDHAGTEIFLVGASVSAVTSSDGTFELTGAPAGSYRLVAIHAGHQGAEAHVEVVAGEVTVLDDALALVRLPDVTGTVSGLVLLTGAPSSEGVTVAAAGTAFAARTDADGAYRLVLPPGDHELTAYAPGFESGSVFVTVDAGEEVEADPFELHRPAANTGRVEGVVTVDDGGALVGIEVSTLDRAFVTRTDASGAYALELPEGNHGLVAQAEGYWLAEVEVTVETGETVVAADLALVALPTQGELRGVVEIDGSDLDFADVRLFIPGTSYVFAPDSEGAFSLLLPPGTYEVVAAADGYASDRASFVVVAGEQTDEATLTLRPLP